MLKNSVYNFNISYHNIDNIKIFYEFYKMDYERNPYSNNNFITENEFIERINGYIVMPYIFSIFNWDSPIDSYDYYIYSYIYFLLFNKINSSKFSNIDPSTIQYLYSVKNFNNIPVFNYINLYALNYNINDFQNIENWKVHYNNILITLKFIEDNGLKVSVVIKNYKEDLDKLNKIAEKYFDLLNSQHSSNSFDEYETFIKKNKFKNTEYNSYPINSIYTPLFLKEYITSFKESVTEIENLKIELIKSKDYYLTVSGAAMALISLVIGNIGFADKCFPLLYTIIFNISILISISIFCYFFRKIYTNKK